MIPALDSYRSPVNSSHFDALALRVGVDGFHDFQKQAITSVAQGRDVFLVVPTGSGKSLCYVVPSLFMPGLVVVVSPLIALMRDQQRQLDSIDVPSLSFDSHLSPEDKKIALRRIADGEIKVLFISPERLALSGFREMLKGLRIAMVAIDEAHCVQQWGQGFRPEYLRIGQYLDELGPAPRMALTATVTQRERLEISRLLRLKDPQTISRACVRENLQLGIQRHSSQDYQKQHILHDAQRLDEQGIIYAATRKNVEEIHRSLRADKASVALYHGGLLPEARQRAQDSFLSGKTRIMVATKAFGMGINLPRVRFVVHANMPCSIESYAQEIGRAGRDGFEAQCLLHYGPKDYFLQKFMIEKSFPEEKDLAKIWQQVLENFADKAVYRQDKLEQMLSFQTLLPLETISHAVEFLLKEQALLLTEAMAEDEHFGTEAYLSLREPPPGFNQLVQALREQVAWRFDKLNAMHRLVKESSCPRQSIEQYFQ